MSDIVNQYTKREMDLVVEYLKKEIGLEDGGEVCHEKESKYVHTDVLISKASDGYLYFATFGMGAGEMNAPEKEFMRAEMILMSNEVDKDEKKLVIAEELISLSKYPFENNTWFGMGHTAYASKTFKEHFGYDAFLFIPLSFTEALEIDEKKINYYVLLPIYKEEREWLIENGEIDFLCEYIERYNDIVPLDEKREVIK